MNDFCVEFFDSSCNLPDNVSEKFSEHFPQRSIDFFQRIIIKLDGARVRLLILKVDGEICGGFFAFRIFGYSEIVWSPSYLFVDAGYKSFSLLFIMRAFKALSSNVMDVSPTKDVQKILKAFKYKPVTRGSYLIPAFLGLRKLVFGRLNVYQFGPAKTILEGFENRSDLYWFEYKIDSVLHSVCLKRANRYGVDFFILVYVERYHISALCDHLVASVAKINVFGVLVVPNMGQARTHLSFLSSKFHAYSNANVCDSVYSIIGSEVTEAI